MLFTRMCSRFYSASRGSTRLDAPRLLRTSICLWREAHAPCPFAVNSVQTRISLIMSAAPTPSASSPEATSPAAAGTSDASSMSAMDKIVVDYLRSRGHESAATALGQALGGDGASTSTTLSAEELLKKMAVFAASGTGENSYKSTANILQELPVYSGYLSGSALKYRSHDRRALSSHSPTDNFR